MALPIQKMVLNLANSLDSHFFDSLNNRCTEDNDDCSVNITEAGLFSSIKSALELPDNKKQILEIKQVCCDLRAVYGSGIDGYACEPLELVVNIYLNCQPKHPVKRIFASTFQNYPQWMQHKIQFFMQQQIKAKLETYINIADHEHIPTLRKNVDMLACLLENFNMGEDCLGTVVTLAMKFLSISLTVFTEFYSKNLSPVRQNETMHNCLVSLQTANRILQKCHGVLSELLATSTDWFIDISSNFVRCDLKLLEIDDFMLDCKCACGMNLTLLLKFNCPNQLLTQLLSTIFGHDNNIQEPVPAHPWLQESGLTLERISQLSSASLLCLFYGILAMLDTEDLVVEFSKQQCLLIDVFPDKFLQLGKLCADTGSKLLAGKCIYLWTTRAQSCLKSNRTTEDLKRKLQGQEVTMQKVLNFVWTTWEDTVDAIRLNARDVFTNTLKIHSLTVSQESHQDVFLQNLATTLINDVSWSCKGKYGSLCSMVVHVGTTYFLSVKPSLPGDVLTQMKEQTLSCYASELYLKLSEAHGQEVLRLDDSMQKNNGWHKIWINPVLEVLSGTNKLQKLHVIEYVLPKLLNGNKLTLKYMIDVLTPQTRSSNQTGTHELGALITCLRRARGMGLLKCQDTESPERLYGIVDVSVVKDAVKHFDEQVRLDALALLCENQRTAELITKTEFDLLKCFLPWNLNSQSPSFRQYMLAHLKKLFFRVNESEGALIRNIKQKKPEAEKKMYISYLANYQEFMTWTLQHMFHCLPGSSFARRTTCLSVLSLMIDLLGKNVTGDSEVTGFDPLSHIDQPHLQSLMECLTDTFEENKQEATKLLQYCSQHNKPLKTDQLDELFTTALKMAASPRPQDCTTAAYLFKVLLHTPGLYQHLRGADYFRQKLILSGSGDSFDLPSAADDLSGRSLMLLWILLAYLKDQKEVAKTSLIMAAANRPMYPTLHCIRYILFDVNLRSIQSEYLQYWQTIVQDLILHCLEISEIVSPVVHNSSPEGNVPAETIRGPGLNFDAILQSDADKALMLEAEEKSKQTVMLMPEYLVVCCWRNIKEVSLLLGQLNLCAPITDPHNPQSPGLLSCDQIGIMGDYFTKQLLESKHRGAFELAYTGFVKMAEMLWKSNIPELHRLPQAWLQEVMVDIRSDDPNSRLCATRRSAGVPFYVQTLVTTEPPSTGRTCFKQAMADLLQMALQDNTGRTTASNPQVHALNTLRALFKDTRLGEDVAPFVADGVKAAILGFQNPFWAVRNSATLLLSAMMTRVFGVKRSKDESNISRKNCQTGRAFFHRYPTLYKFLLDQLADATQNIGGDDGVIHLHPALYPVLMVLGRLFPSHLEGTDTTLNLAAFIPHVIKCSCSPVYKTRVMSAKALHPLVLHDQLTSVLKQLLHMLPDTGSQPQSHNLVHGVLLQMKQLLQTVPCTSDSCRMEIQGVVIPYWKEKVWLISRENPCFVTRTEALNVSHQLLTLFNMDQSESMLHIWREVHNCVLCEMTGLSIMQISFLPGFSEFISTVASFALKNWTKGDNSSTTISMENLLVQCLKAPLYEVRLTALEFLCSVCCYDNNSVNESDTEETDICLQMPVSGHKELKRIIENSEDNLEQLIGMGLGDKKHHECVVKVFEVLTHHPVFRNRKLTEKTGKLIQYSQILKICLNIIDQTTRDEMRAQVLYFTGSLITPVLDSISKGSAESRGDNLALLHKWYDLLTEYSSTEQSYQLQLSCIKVIGQNVHQLLQDPNNVLGDLTFKFWTIVINLLQEDDMEVKQEASQLMSRFLGNQTNVHPFLCLDILVSHMVSLHGRSRSLGCLMTLIMWIKGPTEDRSVMEERLFDKGEMNTYREDIIFIQLVTKHLLALLIQLSKCQGQNWTVEVKDTPDNQTQLQDLQSSTRLPAKVTMLDVDKLKETYTKINQQFPSFDENCVITLSLTDENVKFFEELEATLSKVLCELEETLQIDQKVSVSAPYLDVALYKSSITNIQKTLQLVGVARCLMSDKLTQICDSLMESIRYKLCTDRLILNSLLSENVMYPA